MSSANEDSSVPVPNPSDSRPPELQRGTFTRVNTYIPEDLSIKLQSVPARIRKSVTEGYATNRWHGEPTPPSVSNARAQLGLGMGRPSIFQSPNEGFRRVATTPHVMPSNPAYTAIPRFADFGEAPSRPLPHVGGVRARVASLGNYPSAAPVPPASESGSPSKNPRTAKDNSDSDSEPDVDAKSASGSDAFGELFEAGEDRTSSAGSSMFGSRPSALPMLDPAPRQPRQFQQTQSLPAGSLTFGIGTGHGVGTLDSLNEDEPWRQYDFSKYAAMPPE